MSWIKIEKGCKMPKEGEIVDLWTDRDGRLCNYRLNKNYGNRKGNNFFSPTQGGTAVVRYDNSEFYCNATHWMRPAPPPKG